MEHPTNPESNGSLDNDDIVQDPERLAVKTICASDILKNVVESAQRLNKLDKILQRYLNQARLLLVWKRGSGAMKMAGSAAKVAGSLMIVTSRLNPRINIAIRIAHRLWKVGTSIRILNAIANIIKDVWQKGCRNTLLEFTHCAASLTRNLSVFGEVLRDLQAVTPSGSSPNINGGGSASHIVLETIREFIPAHQIPYATHVINMAFGNEHYSPLFAFTSITLDAQNNSNIAQLMLEIESFHFDDFAGANESKSLVVIGSFIHVSRELFDFLDGFQRLTDGDLNFLHDCLKRFAEESGSIMKAVSVLVSLDRIRKQLNASGGEDVTQSTAANTGSLYDTRDIGGASTEDVNTNNSLSNESSIADNSESRITNMCSNSQFVEILFRENDSEVLDSFIQSAEMSQLPHSESENLDAPSITDNVICEPCPSIAHMASESNSKCIMIPKLVELKNTLDDDLKLSPTTETVSIKTETNENEAETCTTSSLSQSSAADPEKSNSFFSNLITPLAQVLKRRQAVESNIPFRRADC